MRRNRRRFKSLLAWRRFLDLNQAEAARLLGVDTSVYCRWENREGYPETKKLLALSQRTGVPLERLLSAS